MTLHYNFPCIQTWHTVAKHFEDNKNFVVADKDGYFVVNYLRAGVETHPPVVVGTLGDYARAAVLREARGMVFCSKTGELLSRPLHKFFNLGEREDVVPDFTKPHLVLEKLDGSMVRPFMVNGSLKWGTKMGETDVSAQAAEFVKSRPEYESLARALIEEGSTPIFEWCSRKQRIVIDYPEDKLVLLTVRDNFTGEYAPRFVLESTCKTWGIPLVDALDTDPMTTEELVKWVRAKTDAEGVVIQFNDGHMVKVKADQYVMMHRAKSMLENERDVVGLVLDEKTDDLMPLLCEEDRKRLHQFESDVWYDLLKFNTSVNAVLKEVETNGIERKRFALASESMEPMLRAAVFKHFDVGACGMKYVVETVRKHLGSKSSYEKVGGIIKTASWKEIKVDE